MGKLAHTAPSHRGEDSQPTSSPAFICILNFQVFKLGPSGFCACPSAAGSALGLQDRDPCSASHSLCAQ